MKPNYFSNCPDPAPQTVRLVKASQAVKLLRGHTNGRAADAAHQNPEIRLVGSGADYCDLQVICSCGENLQIRCWTGAAAGQKTGAGE
jgi:hypothetical protein